MRSENQPELKRCPAFVQAPAKGYYPPVLCRRLGFQQDQGENGQPKTLPNCPFLAEGSRDGECNVKTPTNEAVSPPFFRVRR